ncbi:MAG: hypothetical protein QNJ16_09555 [Rhodobacter sp.]|nr:hypothetical protein [Rhodobacter sp.]
MGLVLMGNALLMLSSFAVQFGLLDEIDFGGSDADSEAEAEDTPSKWEGEGAGDLLDYIPDNFLAETTGTAADESFVADETGNQAWFLMEGDDTLDATDTNDYADGGAGDDLIYMRPGDDIALGGAGDDTIDGGFGSDVIDGGTGDDVLNGAKDDDLVLGGDGNDLLTGSEGADRLEGGAGDDTLVGNHLAGADATGDGADTLIGGEGDDVLLVAGGDEAQGGAGADDFQIQDPADSGAMAVITDFNAAEDVIGLAYDQQTDPTSGDPIAPEITLTPNAAGTAATLSVDGIEVAVITGGQGLTPADIALFPEIV